MSVDANYDRDLEADGGTFFDLTQYLYRIRKPE